MPKAVPAVLVSFVVAGLAAGLSAICYAEIAVAVSVSGPMYSYDYTTMGEMVAMGVAACCWSTAYPCRRSRSVGVASGSTPSW